MATENARQIMAGYERLVAEARAVVSIMCACERRYDTLEDYDLPTLQWCEAEFSPAVLIVHWMDESHIEDFGASPERKDIPAHFLFSRDWVDAYRVEAQEKQAQKEVESADREIERLRASLAYMEDYRETLNAGEAKGAGL